MSHYTQPFDATQVGRDVYYYIAAAHSSSNSFGSTITLSGHEYLATALGALQAMNKQELLAAWDGFFQSHFQPDHLARVHIDKIRERGTSQALEDAGSWICYECQAEISDFEPFSVQHSINCSMHPENCY